MDWTLVAAAAGLLAIGTVAMLSAASPMPFYPQILKRHFFALFVGMILFVIGFGLNYQVFQDQARTIYFFVLLMMLGVLLLGTTQRGHKSWFALPFLSFQPVELARLGMIFVLANFLDRRARKAADLSTVFWALAIVGPVMLLVLKQPDFASMLTFFPLLIGMLFCAGSNLGHLLALAGFGATALAYPIAYIFCQIRFPQAAVGSIPHFFLQTSKMGLATAAVVAGLLLLALAVWRLSIMMRMQLRPVFFVAAPMVLIAGFLVGVALNKQLKGYQRNRFVAFLAPETDILGASYNVHQSEIAIGSGGLWGKGLFSGTQGQLGFLPERHTDFIYAIVGEEMGFLGTIGILAFYLLLIWRVVEAGRLSRDRFGYLVCAGLAALFGFYLLLNVGMCLGLMPVAGIPLPMISYGGSSLVVTLWSLGIVANIYSKRFSFH